MTEFNLFDFQQEGLDKLRKKKSCLIAWEMGLGKTYIGLALDDARRFDECQQGDRTVKKTLVVCPTSIMSVWEQHGNDLTNLPIHILRHRQSTRKGVRCDVGLINFEEAVLNKAESGIYVCNYEALRRMPFLKKVSWFHIIADECHKIKNRKAIQTKCLKALPVRYKTAMSGTPADDKPQDLWSILNWLWPKYYSHFTPFFKEYCDYEWDADSGYNIMYGIKPVIAKLHREMEPWYSRIRKQEVLKDLPDKYYSEIKVDLAAKQRRAYEQMKKDFIAWVDNHEKQIEENDPIIASSIVVQLQRLQQFALGYMQIGNPATKVVWRTNKEQGRHQVEIPNYVMSEPSAKLDAVMELLDETEGSVAVFSQFKAPLALLARRLDQARIPYGVFTGDVSERDRTRAREDFQASRTRVFLATIAAGGEGITLTRASTVVFLDRHWNPSKNIQAEDRLHRIGQKNAVQVVDVMATRTVDRGRKTKIERKLKWIRTILGDD